MIKVTLSDEQRREACRFYMDPKGADIVAAQVEARLDRLTYDLIMTLRWCTENPNAELSKDLRAQLKAFIK